MTDTFSSQRIPLGYKLTEVGVIPEDWSLDYIENLANITTGSKNTQDRIEEGRYPFFVRSQTVERINSYSFDGEAVLTAGDGVGTGKVFHYINGKFDIHQRVYRISNFREHLDGYYFYLYFSTHFYNRIMQMTAKSSVDSVRREMIARMFVALPPTRVEQRAIAEALSDVDGLLGGLDRLIAKKRDLKQAAMQQLLTGQTRLPGFYGEWVARRLGEITSIPIQNGVFNEPSRKGQGCKLINVIDLYSSPPIDTQLLELFDANTNEIARFGVSHGDIFFTRSSLTPDGIAHCNIYEKHKDENVVFDCHLIRVRPNANRVNPFFLFRYCTVYNARKYLVANAKTTTMTTIDQSVISNLPIMLPTLPEQTAIAAVLSDMDAELAALEQRREKTRALKQAMMQELLTGRTRLV